MNARMAISQDDEPNRKRSGAVLDEDAGLAAAAINDPAAFAPLYNKYFDVVYGYCGRRMENRHDVADATAQIFANALAGLTRGKYDPFRTSSTFRSWLFTIAHNVVIDSFRRSKPTVRMERGRDEASTTDVIDVIDDRPGPEELAINQESGGRLRAALDHLSDRNRSIIELRLAGLSLVEIASVLEMNPSAVRTAQFRAFAQLRTIIDPENTRELSR